MKSFNRLVVKREAAKVLNCLSPEKINEGPSSILESVVDLYGLVVRYHPMHSLVSGILLFDGEDWVIGVNSCQSKPRQAFTLAHEIAHFVLDRNNSVCPIKASIDDIHQFKIERRADMFAAELLMPKNFLLPYIRNGRTPEDVAKMFGLSLATVKIRFEELAAAV